MSEEIKSGYTRVTEILAQWSHNIINEEGDVVAKMLPGSNSFIDIEILNRKRDIGIAVHEAIENHVNGLYTPLNESEVGYFDSYLTWEKENRHKIVLSEKRYYNDELMITGKIDSIISFQGQNILVDYKTSYSENPKMWPLQACFYRNLALQEMDNISNTMVFVQLSKKGALPKVYRYEYTEELWDVCKSALTCYRYINEKE